MAALLNDVNALESGTLCGDGALQPCMGKTARQDKGHARMYGQDIGAGGNGYDGESLTFIHAGHQEHGHPSDMEQHVTLWGRLPNPTCWHQAAPCARPESPPLFFLVEELLTAGVKDRLASGGWWKTPQQGAAFQAVRTANNDGRGTVGPYGFDGLSFGKTSPAASIPR